MELQKLYIPHLKKNSMWYTAVMEPFLYTLAKKLHNYGINSNSFASDSFRASSQQLAIPQPEFGRMSFKVETMSLKTTKMKGIQTDDRM